MIEKDLSPAGKSMRVHFSLPAEVAEESVAIVGDFNDWDPAADPMELQPINGIWKKRISFKPGTEIEFKYWVDGDDWRNDEEADAYVPNEHGTENSLLQL
ncbi:MAG: glycoside hydrolase [Bacteroidetes bacterium]|jgi:1,4-alpha-glucan branching enzyme|nr:glycoside hydrolase [Bacteroidota bacterium]